MKWSRRPWPARACPRPRVSQAVVVVVKVTDYSLSEGCMSEQTNERLVRNLYDAFGRGDIPTILNMLADDVDWYDPGPPAVTHAGRYRGREDVLRFFSRIRESLAIETFQPPPALSALTRSRRACVPREDTLTDRLDAAGPQCCCRSRSGPEVQDVRDQQS